MDKQEVYDLIEKHYREHRDNIVSRLGSYIGSKPNAEDIVQEAYTKALTYWNSYDTKNGVDNWIHTIINNCMKDFIRDEIQQGMAGDPIPPETMLKPEAISAIELAEIVGAIENEPDNIERILKLHLIEGYSAAEIEKVVPESRDNIWKIVQRFREKIRG